MTQLFPRQTVYGSAATSLTATGDLAKIAPARPIVVTDWGITVTTATSGTSGKATGNLRPTAGSTTSQTVGSSTSSTSGIGATIYTDTAGGQMTLAAAAAGTQYAHRILPEPGIASPTNGNTGSTSAQGVQVNPGQEFAVNLGTAMGTAGAGQAFITYFELPAVGDANAQGSTNPMANVSFVQI